MKKLTFIFFLTILFSCTEKGTEQTKISDGILSQEKMIHVLTEIHIAEAALKIKTIPGDSFTDYFAEKYSGIFNANKTDKNQFSKSFEFYTKQPELLDSIYEEVINQLSKIQATEANK